MRKDIKEPVLQRTKATTTTLKTNDVLPEAPLYRRAMPKYVEHSKTDTEENALNLLVDRSAVKKLSNLNQAEEAATISAVKGKQDYQNKKKLSKRHLTQEERNQIEIDDKVKAIDRGLILQGNLEIGEKAKRSLFRRALDRTSEKIFHKLPQAQIDSLHDYTAAEINCQGRPFYTTMNSVLRKGIYQEGKDVDEIRKELEEREKAEEEKKLFNEAELSKENFEAVSNCRAALKQSKLSRDMVFRRATNLQSLSLMLGLKPEDDTTVARAQIEKNIARYNQGEDIVFDRGFLSTTPYDNAGFDKKPDCVEWMIQGHAGDQALYIANHSHFPLEGEVLFQAGTIFRILRICPPETEPGQIGWKVYMETVHTDIGSEAE